VIAHRGVRQLMADSCTSTPVAAFIPFRAGTGHDTHWAVRLAGTLYIYLLGATFIINSLKGERSRIDLSSVDELLQLSDQYEITELWFCDRYVCLANCQQERLVQLESTLSVCACSVPSRSLGGTVRFAKKSTTSLNWFHCCDTQSCSSMLTSP
jgi:hypothetical protein